MYLDKTKPIKSIKKLSPSKNLINAICARCVAKNHEIINEKKLEYETNMDRSYRVWLSKHSG